MCLNDVTNSILSSFIRSKLYHHSINRDMEVRHFRESLSKELLASQGVDRPQVFNYDCLFSDPTVPLHQDWPVRVECNKGALFRFDHFRRTVGDHIIYPRASPKFMSHRTAVIMGCAKITGEECLRMYMQGHDIPDSDIEVRQAWRYNDLTPRTYYAQGGTVFRSSMYAQELFNLLVDAFPMCHRKSRFNLDRLRLTEDDDVWVYDYSSFTTECSEGKYFLDGLSDYCTGYPLRLFDVRVGVVTIDLGEYLKRYNQECNQNVRFYLGDECQRRTGFSDYPYNHNIGGALGVYGNLALDTLLHAIVSMNISGSMRRCSVVGDDGLLIAPSISEPLEEGEIGKLETPSEIKSALRLFGNIAWLKFAILGLPHDPYSSRWYYLKRALIREDSSLELWNQDHLFNLALILQEDPSLTSRSGQVDGRAGVVSFVRQVMSLLLRIYRRETLVMDEELPGLCRLLSKSYAILGLSTRGSLIGVDVSVGSIKVRMREQQPSFWLAETIPYIPHSDLSYRLRENPMMWLYENHDWQYGIRTSLLVRRGDIDLDPDSMVMGFEFVYGSDRRLSLMSKMGIVVREEAEPVYVFDQESMEEFISRLVDPEWTIAYRYRCLRDVPNHFRSVC